MVELRDMLKIVTVGGGTGSFTVLSGLKQIPDIAITAVVSMADDGGSTGVLRDELGVLPPGDVRQCLIALSEHSDIVRKVMGYRFSEGTLAGHSFGNIFLATLEKASGDFTHGVEIASEILKVKGKVVPVTNNKAELVMRLKDGTILVGEDSINRADIEEKGIQDFFYKGDVHINTTAYDALVEADCIVLGPGNYYCSLVPNLIVQGFKEAIVKTNAKIIFPVNLTNKQGHTMRFGVQEYVEQLEKYLGRKIDYVLINNENPQDELLNLYQTQEGEGVLVNDNYVQGNIVKKPLLSQVLNTKEKGDSIGAVRGFIRHDSHKLAQAIIDLL